jgi:hypothetical protein
MAKHEYRRRGTIEIRDMRLRRHIFVDVVRNALSGRMLQKK